MTKVYFNTKSIILLCKLALLLCWVVAILLAVASCAHATNDYVAPLRTEKQEWLHDIAEKARANGEPEDSPLIRTMQSEWWKENNDLCIIAKVINGEAPYCPWDHQVAVGAVVLNRVRSPYFPDTVYDVVVAPNQYTPAYTRNFYSILPDCWEAAKAAMDGNHNVPSDVYWQAGAPQGVQIWWASYVDTGWFRSTTYFCRGIVGIDHY